MTSGPVKDVNPVLKFMGGNNPAKTGMTGTGSFGDLMSKTQSNLAGSQKYLQAAGGAGKPSAADLLKNHTDTTPSQPAKEPVKADQPAKE
ncbi:MAG: hypothetical protein K2P30_16100, partial [Lachnospiraceae bacterium]|nr:hypothetical protein [Lachnospiraceae bacterium]